MAANKAEKAYPTKPAVAVLRRIFLDELDSVGTLSDETWKTWSLGGFMDISMVQIGDRWHLDYDTEVVVKEIKSCEDDDWEQWRNSLANTVGGHTFASFLGLNPGESARKAFARLKGLEQRPLPNAFSRLAMGHGKFYEDYVAQLIRVPWSTYVPRNTFVLTVTFKKLGLSMDLALSPDMLETDGTVSEIKCPFYDKDRYTSSREWAEAYLQNNPKGKPLHWAQALLYSTFLGFQSGQFSVAVGLVSTEDEMTVVQYYYEATDESKDLVIAALKSLASMDSASKLTRNKKFIEGVTSVCNGSFIVNQLQKTFVIHMNGHLEEKREEDSGQDTDDIPGQESFSESLCAAILAVTD